MRGLNKAIAKVVDDEKKTDKFGASAYILRGFGPVPWLHRIERERVADLPLPSSSAMRRVERCQRVRRRCGPSPRDADL